jgi:hypothetical protein
MTSEHEKKVDTRNEELAEIQREVDRLQQEERERQRVAAERENEKDNTS